MQTQGPDTVAFYRSWAEIEAREASPQYAALADAVAEDERAIAFLDELPPQKRQPNLLFAALRWFDAPVHDPERALAVLHDRATQIAAVMRTRATQTNEAARCAVILPALSLIEGPIALLELGASAGLCLLPDQWCYSWTDTRGNATTLGDPQSQPESVLLEATVRGGPPLPTQYPDIVARAGIDASPIDLADPDQRRWLQCLVWPEHTDRAQRLTTALNVAAGQHLNIWAGRFPQDISAAVADLRAIAGDAQIVVLHSAAAAYLNAADRRKFADMLLREDVHRIGLEGAPVSRDLGVRGLAGLSSRQLGNRFVLSMDGDTLGTAEPHGRNLDWWPIGVSQRQGLRRR